MRAAIAALATGLGVALALPALAADWKALNDEAIGLYRKGDLDGAAQRAREATAAAESALGPDHPSVATCLNNLAAILRAEKKYDEARNLYARVLAIRERTAGPSSPEAALALNNLAVLHDAQDQFEPAEAYYLRALDIREKLQPEGLETAATLQALAAVYMAQRKYDRAEPLLVRALAIRGKLLEPKDPLVLATQKDLWTLYLSTERYALAEQYQPEGAQTPNEAQMRRLRSSAMSPKGNDPTVRGR